MLHVCCIAMLSCRMGSLHIDRFLMVYDMRTLRALPPMQVNVEPMFLRCIPVTNRVAMVSQVSTNKIDY